MADLIGHLVIPGIDQASILAVMPGLTGAPPCHVEPSALSEVERDPTRVETSMELH